MKIALELIQQWDTAKELRDYLDKLKRTLERICEMEAEAPTDWFIEVQPEDTVGEFRISLTHLL